MKGLAPHFSHPAAFLQQNSDGFRRVGTRTRSRIRRLSPHQLFLPLSRDDPLLPGFKPVRFFFFWQRTWRTKKWGRFFSSSSLTTATKNVEKRVKRSSSSEDEKKARQCWKKFATYPVEVKTFFEQGEAFPGIKVAWTLHFSVNGNRFGTGLEPVRVQKSNVAVVPGKKCNNK